MDEIDKGGSIRLSGPSCSDGRARPKLPWAHICRRAWATRGWDDLRVFRHGSVVPKLKPVGLALALGIEPQCEAACPEPAQGAKHRVPLPTRGRDKFIGCCAAFGSKAVNDQSEFAAGMRPGK